MPGAWATQSDRTNRPSVIQAVIRLWLCAEDAGTAAKADHLLVSLLRVSKNEPGPALPVAVQDPPCVYGSAHMWRRLFHDRDVYSSYFFYTSLQPLVGVQAKSVLSKRDKTIAQARLLHWLPKVGQLDWDAIAESHCPEIEQQLGLAHGQGLKKAVHNFLNV